MFLFCLPGFSQSVHPSDISGDSLYTHIMYLSSDELQGRGTGTAGEKLAAQYIKQKLISYNIKPAINGKTFYQNIPMHSSLAQSESNLDLNTGGKSYKLKLNDDYLLYNSGSATFIPNFVSLCFVGYGIIAPEYDYNDYQEVDVQDKIVIFLEGEPWSDDSFFFDGHNETIYSSPDTKQRLAISRGARGSILIPNPRSVRKKSWDRIRNEFLFEDTKLASSVNAHLSILINPVVAGMLFENSPNSLSRVYEMELAGLMQSFELNAKISFSGVFSERDFLAKNVAGMIPGREEKYILVSAHYDHLGIGPAIDGDSIYNGLSDNAAGVAALLEIARNLANRYDQLARSIIFLFTTGEEKGLLGSAYYTDHPIVPLYLTSASVNIDGLAIFDEFEDVIGVGGELSSLGDELSSVANALNLAVAEIPKDYFIESKSVNRSDQFSFARAGIPSILIVEGLNYKNTPYQEGIERMINWNETIYHTPFDDVQQNINLDAATQHTNLILEYIIYLSNLPADPLWKPGIPFNAVRLRSIAEKR